MNDAVKYFQKNGLQRSKELVEMGFGFCSLEDGLSFHTEQLKQLVESHELVEKYKNRHGGIRFRIRWGMYRYGDTQQFNDRLKQAIADVESCMEVPSESN